MAVRIWKFLEPWNRRSAVPGISISAANVIGAVALYRRCECRPLTDKNERAFLAKGRTFFTHQHLGHGTSEPSGYVVLLDRHDSTSLACGLAYHGPVKRLQRMHIDHPRLDALPCQEVRGTESRTMRPRHLSAASNSATIAGSHSLIDCFLRGRTRTRTYKEAA